MIYIYYRTNQQSHHSAGVKSEILDDFRPSIGSDPQRPAMNLLWQNGEDLDKERHWADVIVVPERGQRNEQVNQNSSRVHFVFMFSVI